MKCSLKDGFINVLLLFTIAPSQGGDSPLSPPENSLARMPLAPRGLSSTKNLLQDLDSFPEDTYSQRKVHKIVKKQMAVPEHRQRKKTKRAAVIVIPDFANGAGGNRKADNKAVGGIVISAIGGVATGSGKELKNIAVGEMTNAAVGEIASGEKGRMADYAVRGSANAVGGRAGNGRRITNKAVGKIVITAVGGVTSSAVGRTFNGNKAIKGLANTAAEETDTGNEKRMNDIAAGDTADSADKRTDINADGGLFDTAVEDKKTDVSADTRMNDNAVGELFNREDKKMDAKADSSVEGFFKSAVGNLLNNAHKKMEINDDGGASNGPVGELFSNTVGDLLNSAVGELFNGAVGELLNDAHKKMGVFADEGMANGDVEGLFHNAVGELLNDVHKKMGIDADGGTDDKEDSGVSSDADGGLFGNGAKILDIDREISNDAVGGMFNNAEDKKDIYADGEKTDSTVGGLFSSEDKKTDREMSDDAERKANQDAVGELFRNGAKILDINADSGERKEANDAVGELLLNRAKVLDIDVDRRTPNDAVGGLFNREDKETNGGMTHGAIKVLFSSALGETPNSASKKIHINADKGINAVGELFNSEDKNNNVMADRQKTNDALEKLFNNAGKILNINSDRMTDAAVERMPYDAVGRFFTSANKKLNGSADKEMANSPDGSTVNGGDKKMAFNGDRGMTNGAVAGLSSGEDKKMNVNADGALEQMFHNAAKILDISADKEGADDDDRGRSVTYDTTVLLKNAVGGLADSASQRININAGANRDAVGKLIGHGPKIWDINAGRKTPYGASGFKIDKGLFFDPIRKMTNSPDKKMAFNIHRGMPFGAAEMLNSAVGGVANSANKKMGLNIYGGMPYGAPKGMANSADKGMGLNIYGGMPYGTAAGMFNTAVGGMANNGFRGMANNAAGGMTNNAVGGMTNNAAGGMTNNAVGGMANNAVGDLFNSADKRMGFNILGGMPYGAAAEMFNSAVGGMTNSADKRMGLNIYGGMPYGDVGGGANNAVGGMGNSANKNMNFDAERRVINDAVGKLLSGRGKILDINAGRGMPNGALGGMFSIADKKMGLNNGRKMSYGAAAGVFNSAVGGMFNGADKKMNLNIDRGMPYGTVGGIANSAAGGITNGAVGGMFGTAGGGLLNGAVGGMLSSAVGGMANTAIKKMGSKADGGTANNAVGGMFNSVDKMDLNIDKGMSYGTVGRMTNGAIKKMGLNTDRGMPYNAVGGMYKSPYKKMGLSTDAGVPNGAIEGLFINANKKMDNAGREMTSKADKVTTNGAAGRLFDNPVDGITNSAAGGMAYAVNKKMGPNADGGMTNSAVGMLINSAVRDIFNQASKKLNINAANADRVTTDNAGGGLFTGENQKTNLNAVGEMPDNAIRELLNSAAKKGNNANGADNRGSVGNAGTGVANDAVGEMFSKAAKIMDLMADNSAIGGEANNLGIKMATNAHGRTTNGAAVETPNAAVVGLPGIAVGGMPQVAGEEMPNAVFGKFFINIKKKMSNNADKATDNARTTGVVTGADLGVANNADRGVTNGAVGGSTSGAAVGQGIDISSAPNVLEVKIPYEALKNFKYDDGQARKDERTSGFTNTKSEFMDTVMKRLKEFAVTAEKYIPDKESLFGKKDSDKSKEACQGPKEGRSGLREKKTFYKIPDQNDIHCYYELEELPYGCMKLRHKQCPRGEFFSQNQMKCLKMYYWRPVRRKKSAYLTFNSRKMDLPEPNPDDQEPANEWLDATQGGAAQKIPPEFKPKRKPMLKIYHLRVRRKLEELMGRKKAKRKRHILNNLGPTSTKNQVHAPKGVTKRRGFARRHHPRSFLIRINKKEGKHNQNSITENDENESDGDNDEGDEEDDDDEDAEEDQEDPEEDEDVEENEDKPPQKLSRKDTIKEFFRSAKAAVTNRAKFTEPTFAPPVASTSKDTSGAKTSTVDDLAAKSKQVLLDANIKVDSAFSSALKHMLKSRQKDSRDNPMVGNEALISDRGSQDQLDPELLRMYQHLIRNNPRVKRDDQANGAEERN